MKKILFVLFIIASLASAKAIISTLDSPDTNISGLAWGDGALSDLVPVVQKFLLSGGVLVFLWHVVISLAIEPSGRSVGLVSESQ